MAVKRSIRSNVNSEQLRFALDHVQAYVYMKDVDSRYLYANKHTLALFGCTESELIGRSDHAFFPPQAVKKLREIDQKVLAGEPTQEEVVIERESGEQEIYWELKSPIYSDDDPDEVIGVLGISTDITHQKQLESQLIEAASQDFLTGLLNRRQFLKHLESAQRRSQLSGTHCAVIFLDLDRFKQLNDHLGHSAGDAYLVEVGRRISAQVRELDCVARIGGDEFVVLLEGLSRDLEEARNSAESIAQKVIEALDQPFADIEPNYTLSASAGCALFVGMQKSTDEILTEADEYMYQDKRKRAAERFSA